MATTFYRDTDAVLYRQRPNYCGEVLNGTTWQYLPFNLANVREIPATEAKTLAGAADLNAEPEGPSPLIDSPDEIAG